MTVRRLNELEKVAQGHQVRRLSDEEIAASEDKLTGGEVLVARIEQLPFECAGETAGIEFSVIDRSSNEGIVHRAAGRRLVDPDLRCEISTPTGEIIEPICRRLEQGRYRLEFVPPIFGAYTLAIHLPSPVLDDLAPQRFHFWVSGPQPV